MERLQANRFGVLLIAASLGCATAGNSGSAGPVLQDPASREIEAAVEEADVAAGRAEPKEKPVPSQRQRRAEAAAEGAIMGTVVGGMLGPVGAVIGAGVFGLYGLVTGEPPLDSGGTNQRRDPAGRGGGDADQAMDAEIEERRQDDLEREIEDELRRQEELLEQISKQEELQKSIDAEAKELENAEPADPLAAPAAPAERKLPDSIFDRSERKEGRKALLLKTLDADRDGRPEIEIAYDQKSGTQLWRKEDTDYDGAFDVENSYDERGQVQSRSEDANRDGKPDRWTTYQEGVAASAEVDRDGDGVRDGFYTYRNGWRALEEHDTNNDGKIDRRVEYADHRRSLEIEDRDLDGKLETHTFYGPGDLPIRAEIDRDGNGTPEVWEFYEGNAATQVALARKEEDVNGDGKVDVTSIYKNGKLVRKEVNDPSLVQ
jgi:antitoxin component YwqK of YwqJK toxin-antitoxin module